jgi:hypothetical protein
MVWSVIEGGVFDGDVQYIRRAGYRRCQDWRKGTDPSETARLLLNGLSPDLGGAHSDLPVNGCRVMQFIEYGVIDRF